MNNKLLPEVEYVLNNTFLTSVEKSKIIQDIYNQYNQKLQDDLNKYLAKKYLGAALEIGSAAIPMGGVGKAGAIAGKKILKSAIGKKLSQEIGSGALSGLASGGAFGAGRSLLEDTPLFQTIFKDAGTGLFWGSVLGAAGGLGQKYNSAIQLEHSKPVGMMTDAERKSLREMGKQYYKNYLQGRNINAPFIGSVYFPGSQAGEIRLHNNYLIPKLPEQIRNADNITISNDKPNRLDAINFNKLYNSYNNKNYEYIIRNNSNNSGNDFYQIKEVGSNPAYSHHNRALKLEPDNIINDKSQNFNPTKELIPAVMLENVLNPQSSSIRLNGSIEMNVDNFGNPIFTPQKIGELSPEDFEKYLPIIEQQLKEGLIKPQFELPKDYSGFKNPETATNKIYTREDISKMSTDDYAKNEKEILAQMNSIGIPFKNDLPKGVQSHSDAKEKSSYTSKGSSKEGKWVTINGNHVLIEK